MHVACARAGRVAGGGGLRGRQRQARMPLARCNHQFGGLAVGGGALAALNAGCLGQGPCDRLPRPPQCRQKRRQTVPSPQSRSCRTTALRRLHAPLPPRLHPQQAHADSRRPRRCHRALEWPPSTAPQRRQLRLPTRPPPAASLPPTEACLPPLPTQPLDSAQNALLAPALTQAPLSPAMRPGKTPVAATPPC